MTLMPPHVPTYTAVQDRAAVRTPNTSGALFCSTADGKQWVRKGPDAIGTSAGTLAECVSWLLGCDLRVPVTTAGAVLCHPNGDRVWMSGMVRRARTWTLGMSDRVVNLDDFARVLLLDMVVDNGDRHNRNVLLTPERGRLWKVWAIDFDGAGVGSFEAWSAGDPTPPNSPESLPDPCWITELEWPQLEAALELARHDLDGLLSQGAWTYEISDVALRASTGTIPDGGTVDHLAGYLEWRGRRAHTMAKAYWERAVRRGQATHA